MNLQWLFKGLLTINATSWMGIMYAIKKGWAFGNNPIWVCGLLYLAIPIALSLLSLCLFSLVGDEQIEKCQEFSLADNEFLPIYLGYFFLAAGIDDSTVMAFVCCIVFVFIFISQTQYFNPIYLLFGYHYYHILSNKGTRIFVLARGKVIRNREFICFNHLKRINDTTYIELGAPK